MKHLGAGILYTDGKKVLLLHRSKEARAYPFTWASTGGGIEGDEDLLQTAERESKEEIGILKGKRIAQFKDDPFAMYIYRVDKPFNVKLNDEHTKSEWVDLDRVAQYKLHPNFKKEWPKYLRAIEKNNHSFSEWIKRF
jgi:8-oxo-dGTP pyrophosphatase MutT (NUDIX family)